MVNLYFIYVLFILYLIKNTYVAINNKIFEEIN